MSFKFRVAETSGSSVSWHYKMPLFLQTLVKSMGFTFLLGLRELFSYIKDTDTLF